MTHLTRKYLPHNPRLAWQYLLGLVLIVIGTIEPFPSSLSYFFAAGGFILSGYGKNIPLPDIAGKIIGFTCLIFAVFLSIFIRKF